MRLEALSIIFVIIVIPIAIVLSEYVDDKIQIANLELEYDSRLESATRDAITAFQISNVNNSYNDISTLKVKDIEAAAGSYLNAISSNFGYTGYKKDTMQEYVPAIVFTLYDGYYVYGPFTNDLTTTIKDGTNEPELKYGPSYTDNEKSVDPVYDEGKTLYGLKPYVYYSCRYQKGNDYDFIITYTLDNYITVQGIVDKNYVYKYGYLIHGISPDGPPKRDASGNIIKDQFDNEVYSSYKYKGVYFSDSDTETLKEFVGETEYPYAKINGVKYYLDPEKDTGNATDSEIFFIDDDGYKNTYQFQSNLDYKQKLYSAIKGNKSSYEYYKDAYSFTKWVENNLKDIKTTDAITTDISGNTTFIKDDQRFNNTGNNKRFNWTDNFIFGSNSRTIDYEKSDSLFNEHRRNVIRYVVETNLSTTISAFSSKAGETAGSYTFIMPKVSEEDWDLIENDVCLIGFLQGLNLAQKRYNGYSVIPNSLTKEYVDENDIYILTNDPLTNQRYYSKPNDSTIANIPTKDSIGYYAGIWKINFEWKKYIDKIDAATENTVKYLPNKSLGSYSSIVGSSGITKDTGIAGSDKYTDMYDYMEQKGTDTLKTVYFKALARERYGAYHVNNNLDLKYFLDEY